MIQISFDTDQKKAKKTKKKRLTRLEKSDELNADEPNAVSIKTQLNSTNCFSPYDRVRPTYLLKEELNSHNLNEVLRLYILITKDNSRTCPFLLTKIGYLLLKKFIQSKPEDESELCNDLVSFVKFIKYLPGKF